MCVVAQRRGWAERERGVLGGIREAMGRTGAGISKGGGMRFVGNLYTFYHFDGLRKRKTNLNHFFK
jgi:hypothetical protein